MDSFLQDLRYAVQGLVKNPGFTLTVLLTLILGIGANTAIFSIVNAVLIRPLPYPDPDRLVRINGHSKDNPQAGGSEPEIYDFRERCKSYESITAYLSTLANLTGGEEPERVRVLFSTAELMPMVGAQTAPGLGRVYGADDDKPESAPVAVISYGLWQRRFGGDPKFIGKTLTLGGQNPTVIGVMKPGFDFPGQTDIWMPMGLAHGHLKPRFFHYLDFLARLKPGVTVAQAQAEMNTVVKQMIVQYGYGLGIEWGVDLVPLLDQEVGTARLILLVLLGTVVIVLLIACTNVINMLLVRTQVREKEISLRTVLGASRRRLLRQFLTESLVLAGLGAALGLLLAYGALHLFIRLYPDTIPRAQGIALDGTVLGFTLGVAVLTGLAVGLIPAWKASRPDLVGAIKEGGGKSTGGAGAQGLRRLLVVIEIAFALMLLVGAGLLIQSFVRLTRVELGFKPEGVLTVQINLPRSKYTDGAATTTFFEELLRRVRTIPGVQDASLVTHLPFVETKFSHFISMEGLPYDAADLPEPNLRAVSSNYFHTMSIPLRSGREFTEGDDAKATPVAVVDEVTAKILQGRAVVNGKNLWTNQSIIGHRFKLAQYDDKDPWIMVVGVVAPIKQEGMAYEAKGYLYVPEAQRPERAAYIMVRTTTADPRAVTNGVREQLRTLDKDLPLSDVKTMEERLAHSFAQPRFSMFLLSVFAGVALLLAAIGIYGVIAYTVAQRTREIGIRMAMGAQRGDILKQVVGSGMTIVAIGLGVGLVSALLLTRLLTSLLFDVRATDPLTFVGVAVVFAAVSLLAMLLPASRAAGMKPMLALRNE
ncbi:MAG TPA: ABC transporter permease [Thermoanaerobaculia bacterium]